MPGHQGSSQAMRAICFMMFLMFGNGCVVYMSEVGVCVDVSVVCHFF